MRLAYFKCPMAHFASAPLGLWALVRHTRRVLSWTYDVEKFAKSESATVQRELPIESFGNC